MDRAIVCDSTVACQNAVAYCGPGQRKLMQMIFMGRLRSFTAGYAAPKTASG